MGRPDVDKRSRYRGISPSKGRQFTAEVILWAVRWYLMFPISYRAAHGRTTALLHGGERRWHIAGRSAGKTRMHFDGGVEIRVGLAHDGSGCAARTFKQGRIAD